MKSNQKLNPTGTPKSEIGELLEVGLADNPRYAIVEEQTLRCLAEDE